MWQSGLVSLNKYYLHSHQSHPSTLSKHSVPSTKSKEKKRTRWHGLKPGCTGRVCNRKRIKRALKRKSITGHKNLWPRIETQRWRGTQLPFKRIKIQFVVPPLPTLIKTLLSLSFSLSFSPPNPNPSITNFHAHLVTNQTAATENPETCSLAFSVTTTSSCYLCFGYLPQKIKKEK